MVSNRRLRNSSWQRAKCTPVVSHSFEHYTSDSAYTSKNETVLEPVVTYTFSNNKPFPVCFSVNTKGLKVLSSDRDDMVCWKYICSRPPALSGGLTKQGC
ncbi:hypothetical protein TNCV_371781 [Trichonephila clavipes]|nr:hypothetical protein TNCV_371781 [Trichonephila clavipes]